MRFVSEKSVVKVILQVVLVLNAGSGSNFVYAAEPEGKDYIEFIIDASSSIEG